MRGTASVPADGALAHARVLHARGLTLPREGTPSSMILDSWVRCAALGLQPGDTVQVPVVEATELTHRRAQAEIVRRLAQAELETLSRQIAGSNFLLAFADQDGVILDLYADNRFSMSGDGVGIVAGSRWTEGTAGTNGLGTALATGGSVAVTGLEHYFLTLGDVSCTATPVRDAHGRIVGALDASSYYESRQQHTQALVQMAAVHIENGLMLHQLRGQWVLAVHPRAEFLGTLSAGLLAFDGLGRLLSVNGPARQLLAGLALQAGTAFEELFGEPFDLLLARLHRQTEVRLRDALGSALVARAIAQPRPRVAAMSTPAAPRATPALPGDARARPGAAIGHTPVAATGAPRSGAFVADDRGLQEACRLVEAAVRMRVPLLLQGETGTGKEVMARHAHRCSGRTGEFVAVNCAAMPAELFEAELFGYAAGAYTGSRREGQAGLIVAADGGTLLLDEIRELPMALQAALLRFLDDQCVRPVGAQGSRQVDVQLIAASHADLEHEVRERRFREDLLYRLNTVRVCLPPLRERSDLAAIARGLLRELDPSSALSDEAVHRLSGHRWPGNVRELRSVLTRALLCRTESARTRPLLASDIDRVLTPSASTEAPATNATATAGSVLQRHAGELIREAYERHGRSVSRTSRALGISRTTVYRHLKG